MTPYRAAGAPAEERLDTFRVKIRKGQNLLGFLLAMVILFLVAWVVSKVSETPPEIEPWVWTFPLGAASFAIPSIWLWRRRRRELHIVRAGGKIKMVVPGEVELVFPLTASGTQFTVHMRGVPMHHAYLKLVDGDRRGISFEEIRGAVHGAYADWFDAIDKEAPATAYEVSRAGEAARIRARVEEINRKDPHEVT